MVRGGETVGTAHGWVDALEPTGADVVLEYGHELFGRWAAVTHRRVGEGAITVVGTLLDRATLSEVLRDAAGPTSIVSPLASRPGSVTAHSLTGDRGRVWVVHNWSPEPRTVRLARGVASVIDDAVHDADAAVALAPWDVRVWREI